MITTTTLKNAAFAIEHDLFTDPDGCNYLVKDGAILRRWEPAEDDGDALRLSVQLYLGIDFYHGHQQVGVMDHDALVEIYQDYSEDRARDTRYAIVRAAAALGAAL